MGRLDGFHGFSAISQMRSGKLVCASKVPLPGKCENVIQYCKEGIYTAISANRKQNEFPDSSGKPSPHLG